MLSYVWPLAVIVISNTVYQVCAKGIPPQMNTYASMTVTYGVATLVSLAAFLVSSAVSSRGAGSLDVCGEFSRANWATVVLGVVITGLEVGFIFAYKAGWKVSTLSVVSNAFLASALLLVGFFLYREQLSWTKLAGVAICLVGLFFINR